jgi:hypothetical protein
MKIKLTAVFAMLALAVAGCQEEPAEQAGESKPPAQQTQSTEAAPAKQESETSPEPPKPSRAPDVETVTNDACLAAAKDQTGESDITVTSNEYSEANTLVMLGVGASRAPWRCLVSNDGQVAELSFEGDDSAGVADQPSADDGSTDGSADIPNYERPVGGVMPDGSSFSATGQISCVRDRDAANAMCDFGVVREGNGNGWVMVFWPDGGSRVIYFENGTPVSFDKAEADGDAEMTVNKDGDTFIVFVGEARFEIFEAVIAGG